MAKGANSGVYHYGERWDNRKGFGGFAPRSNASLPAGEWRSLHTELRAPRFDSAGVQTADTQSERVVYNGVTLHENVLCDGPTRSGMTTEQLRYGISMSGRCSRRPDHGSHRTHEETRHGSG
jgi:hypothetical protein